VVWSGSSGELKADAEIARRAETACSRN